MATRDIGEAQRVKMRKRAERQAVRRSNAVKLAKALQIDPELPIYMPAGVMIYHGRICHVDCQPDASFQLPCGMVVRMDPTMPPDAFRFEAPDRPIGQLYRIKGRVYRLAKAGMPTDKQLAALAVIQAQCQHNGAMHYTDPLTCALCGIVMPSPPTPPAQ